MGTQRIKFVMVNESLEMLIASSALFPDSDKLTRRFIM